MVKSDPRTLAVDLLDRSICLVQVAAVIFDKHGIFAWGWNNVGIGFGIHAEAHAIERSNRRRLTGASIAIAGRRRGRVVPSKPCMSCYNRIVSVGINKIYIQDRTGKWTVSSRG